MKHPFFVLTVVLSNGAVLLNSFYQWAEVALRLALLLVSLLISLITLWRMFKPPQSRLPQRVPVIFKSRLPVLVPALFLVGLLSPGCSYLSSTAYDQDTGKRTGNVKVYTLFDGNSSLTKLRQSKAGTTIGNLNESSSGTNVTGLVTAIVSAAVTAAK